MKHRRFITALTLAAFLPMAVGCSATRSQSVYSGPIAPDRAIGSGEPIAITGWTDRAGESHDWNGYVQAVTADSLEFSRGESPGSTDSSSAVEVMRLSRQDVASIESSEPDTGMTGLLVLTVGVVVLVGTIFFVALANFDDWESSGN